MRGLYQRALEFYNQSTHLRLVRPEELRQEEAAEAEAISAEEKQRIQEQIDELVGQNRLTVTPETLAYTPKRRGALLPLASNLAIGAVLALALLAAFFLYNRQEQSIAAGGAVLLTAESKLIAALRQESEQQLQQKDRAILEIQDRLASISREREQLRSGMESVLSAKEQELRSSFEQRLAAERERLQAQGLSAAAVDRRLADTETALRKEYDAQLASARLQAEGELASKEAAIASLSAQYQRQLELAQGERTRLKGEYERREAEARAQLAAREQELSRDRARVADELAQLRRQQEEERLVLDQILSGYDRVKQALQVGDYSRAQENLQGLKAFFDERGVAGLAAVQKRRGIEFFLIDSLEELIRERQSKSSGNTDALIEASALLSAVADRVERGDELARAGQLEAAREAYLDALGRIPAVNRGYGRLEAMRAAAETETKKGWSTALRQGNLFYQAGSFRESLERYRQALALLLNDEGLSRQVAENIQNAGYRLLAADDLALLAALRSAEERRAGLLARLRALKEQYQAYTLLTPSAAASELGSPQSLATLLQAKILMRQILDSEPVRSEHPELAAAMERYFSALGAQKEAEGRRAALQELDTLLSWPATPPLWTSYLREGEPDPLLALFARLETLLR